MERMRDREIRFITSKYEDLFKVPDGALIEINYPDRTFLMKCEYMDEYHFKLGHDVYHICQFAEMMERGGGSCKPEELLEAEQYAWEVTGKGYFIIQLCDDGYDYTFYDKNLDEIDGGQLDNPEFTMNQARNELLDDFGWDKRALKAVDYDNITELVYMREQRLRLQKDNYLKAAEMSMEDDYGMIDGIINNGKKDDLVEKPSVLEQLKCAVSDIPKECAKKTEMERE